MQNFTEQANNLINKLNKSYTKKDCNFNYKNTTIKLKKTLVAYDFHSLVQRAVRDNKDEIEKISLTTDLKGDLQNLENVIYEISVSMLNYPLHFLDEEEQKIYKKLYSIRIDLRCYYQKLLWYFLPNEMKQKYLKLAIDADYNELNKSKREEFYFYIINKYF